MELNEEESMGTTLLKVICLAFIIPIRTGLTFPFKSTRHGAESFLPLLDYTGVQADRVNLYTVNRLFKHKPHLSYSVPMDETFQELPRIIQVRLQRLYCQDLVEEYIPCILYLEALFSQFKLSLEAEALLSASLVFRSILLELTVKALGYVQEIRRGLARELQRKTYLTGSFCFHTVTCNAY